jgi:hypothetical protein
MLDKINRSPVRCPKCNEAMRLVEEAPRFALFLSSFYVYRCDPCHIALSYPPDEDERDKASERAEAQRWRCGVPTRPR